MIQQCLHVKVLLPGEFQGKVLPVERKFETADGWFYVVEKVFGTSENGYQSRGKLYLHEKDVAPLETECPNASI